jgi:hypothetical protein
LRRNGHGIGVRIALDIHTIIVVYIVIHNTQYFKVIDHATVGRSIHGRYGRFVAAVSFNVVVATWQDHTLSVSQ